ncbi:MAG: hypothetical protein HQ515_20285 [Phycisphaeraceae bacterium]|nr:hypothetical protein [Phycisphaeraceae bacterium]
MRASLLRVLRRWGRAWSRQGILVHLLQLVQTESNSKGKRGLVMIQIDALSRMEFERAMAQGDMPFLKHLLDKQHYRLSTLYPGLPCTTPRVQAELFYGERDAVPSFSFYDRSRDRIAMMYYPQDARHVEEALQEHDPGLLGQGIAYSNIFTGGAREAHFCIAGLGLSDVLLKSRFISLLLLLVFHVASLLRTVVLMGIETLLALIDCLRGLFSGYDLWKEIKFVPSRVAVCVLLRDLVTIGAGLDVFRGMPVVHANLMGYHEQSHRRGPSSRFAHWTLKGIDRAVKRIYRAAQRSTLREYDVWIYADHGQEETMPYHLVQGCSMNKTLDTLLEIQAPSQPTNRQVHMGLLDRLGLSRWSIPESLSGGSGAQAVVTALGPYGHIYLPKYWDGDREALAVRLCEEGGVPLVMWRDGEGVVVHSQDRRYHLPQEGKDLLQRDVPFLEEMVQDLVRACHHRHAGDLIICGWQGTRGPTLSFARERGGHGGLGLRETEAFALLPNHVVADETGKGYLRPRDLRRAAQAVLTPERVPAEHRQPVSPLARGARLRVMTYNVHSLPCVGAKTTKRTVCLGVSAASHMAGALSCALS